MIPFSLLSLFIHRQAEGTQSGESSRKITLALQFFGGGFHFRQVCVGIGRIGHMGDFAIEADEETDAAGHGSSRHADTVGIGNLAIGVSEERKVEVIFADEVQMAFAGVKADANNLHILLLKRVDVVAETAGFFSATRRFVFGIEIEQDNFFADVVGEFPVFAVLILALDQWSGIADFRQGGGVGREGGHGGENAGYKSNGYGVQFHKVSMF